ncbi:MAG: iron ABC transporter permease, partial [Lentisphaeraceae bacterium]|nr:iron ABC transporter permease [Lentisphaeraceae bacterium]
MTLKANFSLKTLIAATAFLMLLPLYTSIQDVLSAKESISELFKTRDFAATIGRSLLLAFCTGLGGMLIAIPQAFFLARYRIPGKKLWIILFTVPLVIPSYISAYSYLAAFGNKGFYEVIIGSAFPLQFEESLFGTWLSMMLVNSPFIFLMTYAALLRISPSIEESATILGCSPIKTFFRITLPNLKIPIASGTLLVCLYTLSDFGTPAILNYKTLPYHIYLHLDRGRFSKAAFFALVLIIIALLFLLLETYVNRRQTPAISTRKYKAASQQELYTGKLTGVLLFFSSVVFISLIVPISTIIYWFTQGRSAFSFGEGLQSASFNSLTMAFFTASLSLTLALPIVWFAVRKTGLASQFSEKISFVGNMFPGVVIGLSFVTFFSGFRLFGLSFYQTMLIPILGCSIRFIPQAVSSVKTSLSQMSPRLEEASTVLGKNSFQTLKLITEPLVRPGLLSGFALVFISTLKELPITLILCTPGKRY